MHNILDNALGPRLESLDLESLDLESLEAASPKFHESQKKCDYPYYTRVLQGSPKTILDASAVGTPEKGKH
jgi:hypothetical protein